MAKSDVNGSEANEIFKFLRSHSQLKVDLLDSSKAKQVPWNFSKFLVTADQKVTYIEPQRDLELVKLEISEVLQQSKETI